MLSLKNVDSGYNESTSVAAFCLGIDWQQARHPICRSGPRCDPQLSCIAAEPASFSPGGVIVAPHNRWRMEESRSRRHRSISWMIALCRFRPFSQRVFRAGLLFPSDEPIEALGKSNQAQPQDCERNPPAVEAEFVMWSAHASREDCVDNARNSCCRTPESRPGLDIERGCFAK